MGVTRRLARDVCECALLAGRAHAPGRSRRPPGSIQEAMRQQIYRGVVPPGRTMLVFRPLGGNENGTVTEIEGFAHCRDGLLRNHKNLSINSLSSLNGPLLVRATFIRTATILGRFWGTIVGRLRAASVGGIIGRIRDRIGKAAAQRIEHRRDGCETDELADTFHARTGGNPIWDPSNVN